MTYAASFDFGSIINLGKDIVGGVGFEFVRQTSDIGQLLLFGLFLTLVVGIIRKGKTGAMAFRGR